MAGVVAEAAGAERSSVEGRGGGGRVWDGDELEVRMGGTDEEA